MMIKIMCHKNIKCYIIKEYDDFIEQALQLCPISLSQAQYVMFYIFKNNYLVILKCWQDRENFAFQLILGYAYKIYSYLKVNVYSFTHWKILKERLQSCPTLI